MLTFEIKNKIAKAIKVFCNVYGLDEAATSQYTIMVYYKEFNDFIYLDINGIKIKDEPDHKNSCKVGLAKMTEAGADVSILTTDIPGGYLSAAGIRIKNGIVLMAGNIKRFHGEKILAVVLHKLDLISEKEFIQIKEDLRVEKLGVSQDEKFMLFTTLFQNT